jgi:hypothetical protein
MAVAHSTQALRVVLLVVVVLVELVLVVVTHLHPQMLARLVELVVLVHSTI